MIRLAARNVNISWLLLIGGSIIVFLFLDLGPKILDAAPQQYSSILSSIKSGPRDIHDRLARSESIWLESVQQRRHITAQHDDLDKAPFFPGRGNDKGTPFVVWDLFSPSFTCPWEMQRIGQFGDGGKWVCGMSKYLDNQKQDIVIYSFGVNYDSGFEATMLNKMESAEIFAYDYSVDDFGPQITALDRQRAHFEKVGLGSKDEPMKDPPFYSLKGLMDRNNHSYIDIMKIDIESGEYQALDTFMDDFQGQNLPIGQVLIEIHLWGDDSFNFKRFITWWERLETFGMRATWFEPNLMSATYGVGGRDPLASEYVWINVKDPKSILLRE